MLQTAKKLNGAERKKTDEREQKYSPELEKIVDMPLITSTNMISVVRREGSTDAGDNVDAEKATEATRKCSQIFKSEKRDATLPGNGVSAVKETEVVTPTSARISVPNIGVGESDCAKRTTTTTSTTRNECAKREEAEARGVELNLTPLTNEKAPESDRSGRKDVDALVENGKETLPLSSRACEIDGECEGTKEGKRFCFENSRELAGEPDGKADEGELTESPPALPACPPPIAVAEPRSSFLHGGVINADSSRATKPVVPQKPVILPTKTCPSDERPLAVRKTPNGDYVLPPPSVQNVAVRVVQSSGECCDSHETLPSRTERRPLSWMTIISVEILFVFFIVSNSSFLIV